MPDHGEAIAGGAGWRRLRAVGQTALNASKPPSTGRTTPVTNEADAPESHTTAPATSPASPKLPAGVCADVPLLSAR